MAGREALCFCAMVMMDQSKRLSEPLRWTPGGRLAVIAAATILAVCVIGAGVYGAVHGFSHHRQAGCVDVIVPSTLGGADVHACGGKARTLCSAPAGAGLTGNDTLREQCRQEGYPFRS
jgi:hypothetical protein